MPSSGRNHHLPFDYAMQQELYIKLISFGLLKRTFQNDERILSVFFLSTELGYLYHVNNHK